MPGNKKHRPTKSSSPIPWNFDPHIPTLDFFERRNLADMGDVEEAVDDYIFEIERGTFLIWEAVVCEEKGLPLTTPQKKALRSLISFSDDPDDEILYIDELPRPSEPWYVILNKLATHMLVEPLRTDAAHYQVVEDGWPRIAEALREHGEALSRPPDVQSPEEVVPAELRHKLRLQYCFDFLVGLGQEEELTLTAPDSEWRIEELINRLRECRDSVAHQELTLDSILTRVIMPERDRPVFMQQMQERLGVNSGQDRIADRLCR